LVFSLQSCVQQKITLSNGVSQTLLHKGITCTSWENTVTFNILTTCSQIFECIYEESIYKFQQVAMQLGEC